jgi:hypothetical protein
MRSDHSRGDQATDLTGREHRRGPTGSALHMLNGSTGTRDLLACRPGSKRRLRPNRPARGPDRRETYSVAEAATLTPSASPRTSCRALMF